MDNTSACSSSCSKDLQPREKLFLEGEREKQTDRVRDRGRLRISSLNPKLKTPTRSRTFLTYNNDGFPQGRIQSDTKRKTEKTSSKTNT
jgi:hypothetical protein